MNPDTNKLEPVFESDALKEIEKRSGEARKMIEMATDGLVRADGSPVPKHWAVFKLGEHVVIKDYTFEVKYIGETAILVEPVGPTTIGKEPK